MKRESQIKERPILFSAPMVRAILDGRKTMTRRTVSFVAGLGKVTCFSGDATTGYDFALRDRRDMWNEFREDELLTRCPYGQPGDRLWVRETHMIYADEIAYAATDQPLVGCDKWRPSIFMPRWASRITLKVTGVRVERLQDITEIDAQSEGVDWPNPDADVVGGKVHPTCIDSFRLLWNKINGRDSWASNPWVWVVEFTRVLEVPFHGR